MSPTKKSIVAVGDFCLIKMVGILHTDTVELHLLPESATKDILAEMRFHKDNPMPCICVVARSASDKLRLQECYLMQLTRQTKNKPLTAAQGKKKRS
jgi:hypothetical protein